MYPSTYFAEISDKICKSLSDFFSDLHESLTNELSNFILDEGKSEDETQHKH